MLTPQQQNGKGQKQLPDPGQMHVVNEPAQVGPGGTAEGQTEDQAQPQLIDRGQGRVGVRGAVGPGQSFQQIGDNFNIGNEAADADEHEQGLGESGGGGTPEETKADHKSDGILQIKVIGPPQRQGHGAQTGDHHKGACQHPHDYGPGIAELVVHGKIAENGGGNQHQEGQKIPQKIHKRHRLPPCWSRSLPKM